MKVGALVGVDKYGNKYYEDSKNYFFGKSQKLEFVMICEECVEVIQDFIDICEELFSLFLL